MRVAALDLGSNTFILLIAEVEDGEIIRVIHDEVQVVRLGQGVHQARAFHPDALERVEACLAAFSGVIRKHRVERIRACATSAARDVRNTQELTSLGEKYGIPIEVISGEREADFTYWGTVRPPRPSPVLIIDIGGGSTEFIYGNQDGIISRQSVDLGSVRLTELFVSRHPVPISELGLMTESVKERITALKTLLPPMAAKRITAVAGTATTLAMLDQGIPEFSAEHIEGYLLKTERLLKWFERLAGLSIDERQRLVGMQVGRADVIVAGLMILLTVAEVFGVREFEVSTRGLRFGLARELGSK
jgi:exopolyphosphatase/guanosine-5'-triphosphate,3'-diphosphate pyrophosphatase